METINSDTQNTGRQIIPISWEEVMEACRSLYEGGGYSSTFNLIRKAKVYGIPRGGIFAAQAFCSCFSSEFEMTESPVEADIIIDDIIDTGKTIRIFEDEYQKPVIPLFSSDGRWLEFPWERMQNEAGPEENIRRIFEFIGEDPDREGLRETPSRVVRSWGKIFGGYKENVEEVFKIFEDDSTDEMIILRDIEFYSTCEHHLLPFSGKAHIAYIPDGKVIGISKLARILEIYSRRAQIQERLCRQITGAIMSHLNPKGAACILEAQHLCMTSRGVEKQNSIMITSSLEGVFKDNAMARSEFMTLIRRG